MWDLRLISGIIRLGAVIAFVVALTHLSGNIQVGGREGMVFSSHWVLVLAPIVFVLMTAVNRLTYRR